MDADWGSSSDEETAAEREARDEAKRKETEKLLSAFKETCAKEDARIESKYGSMDARERFEAERSAAVGKAMWEERKARAGKEAEEERDLQRINKLYIAAGIFLFGVLCFALYGLYNQFTGIFVNKGSGKKGALDSRNATSGGLKQNTRLGDVHLPPAWLFAVAGVAGIGIPTCVLSRSIDSPPR